MEPKEVILMILSNKGECTGQISAEDCRKYCPIQKYCLDKSLDTFTNRYSMKELNLLLYHKALSVAPDCGVTESDLFDLVV